MFTTEYIFLYTQFSELLLYSIPTFRFALLISYYKKQQWA
jgi:hypothetical protein